MQNRFILTIFLMMLFFIRATYSNAQNQSIPITNKTVNNILYDYKNNKISYFSKEHPKSFGLNVEIEYPKDWLVAEGKRPHIVQKFIERNHKAECMLLIQKVPEILSQSEWKIEWDYLAYYDDAKKEFIKEHNINGNLNVISTQYEAQPGIMLEYATSGSRAGSNFFSETIQHLFGYKNMMICLQCYVVGNTIDDAKKNMITYAPLFKAMGNDIILHNIYTDEYNLENNTHNISSNYDFDINKLYKKEVLLSNKVNEDASKTMDDFFREIGIEKEIKEIYKSKKNYDEQFTEIVKLLDSIFVYHFFVMSSDDMYNVLKTEIESLETLKKSDEKCFFRKVSGNLKNNIETKLKSIKKTKNNYQKEIVILSEDEFLDLYANLFDLYKSSPYFNNIIKMEMGKINEIPEDELCDTRIERLKKQLSMGKEKFALFNTYLLHDSIDLDKLKKIYPDVNISYVRK